MLHYLPQETAFFITKLYVFTQNNVITFIIIFVCASPSVFIQGHTHIGYKIIFQTLIISTDDIFKHIKYFNNFKDNLNFSISFLT